MNKTDKKMDYKICNALASGCEIVKAKVEGFQWLTHFVNYKQFPNSLSIVCIFDTNAKLAQALDEKADQTIASLIENELQKIDINLKDIGRHISYDSEETFRVKANGNWQKYFKNHRNNIRS